VSRRRFATCARLLRFILKSFPARGEDGKACRHHRHCEHSEAIQFNTGFTQIRCGLFRTVSWIASPRSQ
ncbi:MAG: hypothetical protein ACRC7G_04610, partial [Beijerinckiaceae bacterium]